MRFMFLTPGTGHFYCGSCLRDNALAVALRKLGHEISIVPLYLPLVLEDPPPDEASEPVHMGGINMYLQQKSKLAAKLPRFLANLLDRPGLLRWASRRGSLTEAPDLGEMTLSMLQGEDGRQNAEVEKLVEWTAAEDRPDFLVISNILLAGIVHRLKERLGCPVIATLQGEAPFLDTLPQPYRDDAWHELRQRVQEIDAFVPVSRDYGETMRDRLGFPEARMHTVHNGLDLAGFEAEPTPLADRTPPTIGYLARMCRDKGVHTLVDAFIILKKRDRVPDARLRVCGVMLKEDHRLIDELRRRLHAAGLEAEFLPNVERKEKLAFLRSLAAFSVPATYGESFGLYLLEAMACGVPLAQPRHGAFPEILAASGAGVLCEPDDPASLATALEELLLDGDRAQKLASAGRRAVLDHFHADRMAREFATICETVTR